MRSSPGWLIMDILYKDYITFNILDNELNVFSEETDYGLSTVIEFGDRYYYLGNEPPTLESVLFAYQDMQNINFTNSEISKITESNL